MTPLVIISNFVSSHNINTIHSQIDQLVKIALITDNGLYETPADREELFAFKEDLTELINAAYQTAGK